MEKSVITKVKDKKILEYTISQYVSYTLFCALCGFLAEDIGRMITLGNVDSRYMHMPFIMPYGLGVLVAYLALGRPSEFRIFGWHFIKGDSKKERNIRRVLYYVFAFCCITFGEMGYGLLVEATTGRQLWNYNDIPLHITQYTSIPTSFLFTTGVFVVMEYFTPAIMRFFDRNSSDATFVFTSIILLLSFTDMIVMMIRLFANGYASQWWSIDLPWAK